MILLSNKNIPGLPRQMMPWLWRLWPEGPVVAYRHKKDPRLWWPTEKGKVLEIYWEGNPSEPIDAKEKMHAHINKQWGLFSLGEQQPYLERKNSRHVGGGNGNNNVRTYQQSSANQLVSNRTFKWKEDPEPQRWGGPDHNPVGWENTKFPRMKGQYPTFNV